MIRLVADMRGSRGATVNCLRAARRAAQLAHWWYVAVSFGTEEAKNGGLTTGTRSAGEDSAKTFLYSTTTYHHPVLGTEKAKDKESAVEARAALGVREMEEADVGYGYGTKDEEPEFNKLEKAEEDGAAAQCADLHGIYGVPDEPAGHGDSAGCLLRTATGLRGDSASHLYFARPTRRRLLYAYTARFAQVTRPQGCLKDYVPCPPPVQSIQEWKDREEKVAEKSRKTVRHKVSRSASARAEEWRARGLERVFGPYPGVEKHANLLRELEEAGWAEPAMGLAC